MTAVRVENPFVEFVDRYAPDPVLMVREVFGADPDDWQRDVLDAYGRGERRISIRSGHGVGKTTCLAWIVCHHLLCRFPQKTICTAPTAPQLFNALAAEIKGWLKKLPLPLQQLFEIKSERIELIAAPEESFVAFNTSRAETPEAMAGVHSDHVLLIGDEASGIPEAVYESASGSMSGHNATTILAGNPIRLTGLFHATHTTLRGSWWTLKVSCLDSPRVSPDFIDDMRARFGEEKNPYRVRVLGEFPLADDDAIIPFELAELALMRDVKPKLVQPIWGLDVARLGSDRCALAKRQGNVLLEPVESWRGRDTMQTVGRVKAAWDATPASMRPSEICVDAIGIGAGVADRLRELKLPARSINVSESPAMKEQYRNLRTELWFKAQTWFLARDCRLWGETPPPLGSKDAPTRWQDDALMGELIAVPFAYQSNGKTYALPKDEVKLRTGGMSPDLADAFVLTFASDAITASPAGQALSWKQPLKRLIRGIV